MIDYDALNALAIRARADKAALNELIDKVGPVIGKLTNQFHIKGMTREDINQECRILVIGLVDTYDGKQSFAKYVYWCLYNRVVTMLIRSKGKRVGKENYWKSLDTILVNTHGDRCPDFAYDDDTVERRDAQRQLKELEVDLWPNLSERERQVYQCYKDAASYPDDYYQRAAVFMQERYGVTVDDKAIDNGVYRIRVKALAMLKKKKESAEFRGKRFNDPE